MYPKDLIPIIRRAAKRKGPFSGKFVVPPNDILERLLDVAFEASHAVEEGRRPGFRVILESPDSGKHKHPVLAARARDFVLTDPRPYTAAEVTRLAPAADVLRTMIGISITPPKPKAALQIWGLLDVGASWYQFMRHEARGGHPPPQQLTVTSLNGGEIAVSAGGRVFATLRGGTLSRPTESPMWKGPVNDFLRASQKALYADAVETIGVKRWDEHGHDDEYPLRLYVQFIERIMARVREKRHGGTILVVPNYLTGSDTRLIDRVNIKYSCSQDTVWKQLVGYLSAHHRFYELHFPLWESKTPISVDSFQRHGILESEIEEAQELLGDNASAIAGLTGVDGALVLTDRFRVLGFGAEVIVPSPALRSVKVISAGAERILSIDSFGTRHRSAFRFCSSLEDAIALVVSQDGAVRAVKRVGSEVVMWDDINAGGMGI